MDYKTKLSLTGLFTISLIGSPLATAQEPSIGIINPQPFDQSVINRPVEIQTKVELVPLRLQQIRRSQLELGARAGVSINIVDSDVRSQSSLRGVPDEFRNVIVDDSVDIRLIAEEAGKYYGFRGSEELRHVRTMNTDLTVQYHFRQYINDIQTDNFIIADVDKRTNRILRFRGTADLDLSYPAEHILSSDAAFQQVLRQMRQEGLPVQGDEDYQARLSYSVLGTVSKLDLAWTIDVEARDGSLSGSYLVGQDGRVKSRLHLARSEFRLCDGRNRTSATIDCDDVPIVIDEAGVCSGGVYGSCTGAAGVPYYAAEDAEGMIEDVMNTSIDLGTPNSGNGGNVDIMVLKANDAQLQGAHAAYATQGSTRATILVDRNWATDPTAIHHEIGHAGHAAYSPDTYYLDTGSMTTNQRVEYKAVREFIGEMMELGMDNYNGPTNTPKFDSSPTWVSRAGYNYSFNYEYSDMDFVDNDTQPYENARVGGHAMYELVSDIGYEAAFRAFLGAIANLEDDNANNTVSWQELRNAMTYWAILNGGGSTLYAIMDAWHSVGVGDSSTGDHNPPTDWDPGAPPTPTVSYLLVNQCVGNETWYDVYHTSTGATYFRIFGSTGGSSGPYAFIGQVNSSPTPMYTVGNGWVKVQACANNACSLLSSPVQLQYQC